jgi:hypothetical protein
MEPIHDLAVAVGLNKKRSWKRRPSHLNPQKNRVPMCLLDLFPDVKPKRYSIGPDVRRRREGVPRGRDGCKSARPATAAAKLASGGMRAAVGRLNAPSRHHDGAAATGGGRGASDQAAAIRRVVQASVNLDPDAVGLDGVRALRP